MSDAMFQSLRTETKLLSILLERNKSQHRRSNYYRAMSGAATALKRLEPESLRHLIDYQLSTTSSVSKAAYAHAVDAAVVDGGEAAHLLLQAATALRQQLAAGYFVTLMLALLSVTARLLALLRLIVQRLLGLRRSVSEEAPPVSHSLHITIAVEWLITFGRFSQPRDTILPRGSAAMCDTQDDIGESTAGFYVEHHLLHSISGVDARETVLTEPAAPVEPSSSVLLSTDYSDSEGSSDEKSPVKAATVTATATPSTWCIDTSKASMDFFASEPDDAQQPSRETPTKDTAHAVASKSPAWSFIQKKDGNKSKFKHGKPQPSVNGGFGIGANPSVTETSAGSKKRKAASSFEKNAVNSREQVSEQLYFRVKSDSGKGKRSEEPPVKKAAGVKKKAKHDANWDEIDQLFGN